MTTGESFEAFTKAWPMILDALGKFAFSPAKATAETIELQRSSYDAQHGRRKNRRRMRPRNYRARSRRAN